MTTLTAISTPYITTDWNGSSFDDTQSIVVPSGAEYLCVRVGGSEVLPASVTLDGDAMTLGVSRSDENLRSVAIYYIESPSIGTVDLVVNTGFGERAYQLAIDSLSAVGGVGAFGSAASYSTTPTVSVATAVDDLILDVVTTGNTATVGAGQTASLLNTNFISASSEVATTTSTTMSWSQTSERWAIAALVFQNGVSGPTVNSITDPIIGTEPVTIVLSEAAPTVDTIEFTVGTVTQSQSYTTGDDTTFTISAVTRDLLPPIGTVTVELKAGVSVIASTTSTLQQAAGYSATIGVGVDDGLALPHTGTLADGDIVLLSDDPNTSIDAAFTDITQTVRTAFTAQVWSAGTETWGDVVIFAGSSSGDSSVISDCIQSVILQSVIS